MPDTSGGANHSQDLVCDPCYGWNHWKNLEQSEPTFFVRKLLKQVLTAISGNTTVNTGVRLSKAGFVTYDYTIATKAFLIDGMIKDFAVPHGLSKIQYVSWSDVNCIVYDIAGKQFVRWGNSHLIHLRVLLASIFGCWFWLWFFWLLVKN